MKKILSILLTLVMLATGLSAALAEAPTTVSPEFAAWAAEQARLAAAAMQGGLDAGSLSGYGAVAAGRIAGTDYAATAPECYACLYGTAQQEATLKAVMGAGDGDLAKGLAYMINNMVRFPEFATQAANAALVDQPVTYEGDIPADGMVMILLFYKADLVLLAVDCANGLMSASYILSDESTNAGLKSQEGVSAYVAQLGLGDIECAICEYKAPASPEDALRLWFADQTLEAAKAMHAGFSGEGLSGYEQTACSRIGSTEFGAENAQPVRYIYINVTPEQIATLKMATGAGSGEIAKIFAYFLNTQGFGNFATQAAVAALVNQPIAWADGELPKEGGAMVLMCFESDMVALVADFAEGLYSASFVISDSGTTRNLGAGMVGDYAKQVGITTPVDAQLYEW